MKRKIESKKISYLFAVLFVGLIATSVMAYAYRGDPNTVGPNYNENAHNEIVSAIESGDYNAWITARKQYNLPMRGKIFSVINEDNLELFRKMREARLNGDLDRVNEIREELRLGQGNMKRGNSKMNRGSNFVDSNNDGICDNYKDNKGRIKRGYRRNKN